MVRRLSLICRYGINRINTGVNMANTALIRIKNKGFVLSLDAMIGVSILIVFLVLSYSYTTSDNTLHDLSINLISSDIMAVMDNTNTLQSLNQTIINNSINSILPIQYGMRILVNCTLTNFEVGEAIAQDASIYAGKRYFATNNDVCYARYFSWLE